MIHNPIPRSAGVLMHITSLPSRYGIGDFGKEAFQFAELLKQAGQQYWQILPLNPVDETKGYSPYSPLSAFAGNTLLISPDILLRENYLEAHRGIQGKKPTRKVDFNYAVETKTDLLLSAYRNYCNHKPEIIADAFHSFCKQEAPWLNDYTLFITLRRKLGKPWYEWPPELRDRESKTIQEAEKSYSVEIECEKYAQFLFIKQWQALKSVCNKTGIRILGDIPIYISHDSADVWSHPHYWKLDRDKLISAIAGVPPDYFNDKGQLWNMPVYDWTNLKKDKYDWWIQRLRKNLELFDLVRLDHFRGFSTYWEVKGGSADAVDGKWMKGPAEDLFDSIQNEFPEMPFIAEDLGDIDQEVYDLRDRYKLPGMRILQFAFDGEMAKSVFIPFNYTSNSVVYTGTHDNNTVKGWFMHEAGKKSRKNLNHYLGRKITRKNCHKEMIRECYKSIARIAVIPMQDILGLGRKNRMNFPSTETGNWLWRMKMRQFNRKHAKKLYGLTKIYGRTNIPE